MYQIGLSTLARDICGGIFERYRRVGIAAAEVTAEEKDYAALDFPKIKAEAEANGIKLWSFHLPFSPFDTVDISKRSLFEDTVAYLSGLMEKAAGIGIDKFVIHASGEPIADGERADRIACSRESLARLAETAERHHAVVAVEDLPRTCLGRNSDEILQLVSAHDNLRVCFDTNHLLQEDPVAFIHAVGSKLLTLHVSDYDFVDERHWLPGEGKLDWQAILQALKEVGYQGVWMYELGFKCPASIHRDRDLTCEDFVRNATELFENRPITVLSAPRPV